MKKCDESGIALLAALLVLALLSIVILQLDADARHALKGASGFRDQLRTTVLTDAGIQLARAVLQEDARADMQRGDVFDSSGDPWTTPILHHPVGTATVSIRIEDESAYYLSATPPYRAANGPLRSWSELLLIRGVTKEILRRLTPYATIFPIEGSAKINLNTADPLVID